MLSQNVVDHLNRQINLEFYSSNLYLQMSSWCASRGYEGAATFLQAHAAEEMGHMQRLFTYVNDAGGMAVLGAIESPPTEFQSLEGVFRHTLEHEKLVTRRINELVHVAFAEPDYSTFNFLQWYVGEQHEEEKLFKSILDKAILIGADGRGLFFLDKELSGIAASRSVAAPAGGAEN